MDEHKIEGDLSPEEVQKLVQIEELTESGDVVPVPPQINYGISIFAMTDGQPPTVHVTAGELTQDDEIPIPWLIELLRTGVDNLMYQQFKRNLAVEQVRARQARQQANGEG